VLEATVGTQKPTLVLFWSALPYFFEQAGRKPVVFQTTADVPDIPNRLVSKDDAQNA